MHARYSLESGLKAGISILFASFALAGCAIGNSYNYRDADIAVRAEGSGPIGLTVIDRRPYVLSGDKSPAFVGLQRGGFGNPFDVSTESGKPLADEIQAAMADALGDRGYKVVELASSSDNEATVTRAVATQGLPRNLLLVLFEWKTDAMARLGLSYSLRLQVLDASGQAVATASSSGTKESLGPAGFENQNAVLAQQALAEHIEALFNDPEIQSAMASKS